MSEMAPEQAFELFAEQWKVCNPDFHLDDPKVREQLMTLISAAMSLLAVAPPEVWQDFMDTCAVTAKAAVPPEIQQQIKGAIHR